MYLKSSIVFALATITSVAKGQSFPDEAILPGCGETCLDAVVNEASTFGCDAGSVSCLCAAPNFQNGVRDCASAACATDLFPSVTNYLASVCATAVAGVATPAPATTSAAVTSAPPAETTAVPTTSSFVNTAAPISTSSPVAAQSATTSPAAVISSTTSAIIASSTDLTSAAVPSSTQGASSSTDIADGILPTASSSQSSSGLGAAAATTSVSHTSSSATSSSSSTSTSTAAAAPALSAGAKAGIGIGAAIGAVGAIGVIVACIISRKHKSRQEKSGSRQYEISEPMPGAGRVYANDNHSQGFVPESELEMKSRRYEDMMPRHVPRNMV